MEKLFSNTTIKRSVILSNTTTNLLSQPRSILTRIYQAPRGIQSLDVQTSFLGLIDPGQDGSRLVI